MNDAVDSSEMLHGTFARCSQGIRVSNVGGEEKCRLSVRFDSSNSFKPLADATMSGFSKNPLPILAWRQCGARYEGDAGTIALHQRLGQRQSNATKTTGNEVAAAFYEMRCRLGQRADINRRDVPYESPTATNRNRRIRVVDQRFRDDQIGCIGTVKVDRPAVELRNLASGCTRCRQRCGSGGRDDRLASHRVQSADDLEQRD